MGAETHSGWRVSVITADLLCKKRKNHNRFSVLGLSLRDFIGCFHLSNNLALFGVWLNCIYFWTASPSLPSRKSHTGHVVASVLPLFSGDLWSSFLLYNKNLCLASQGNLGKEKLNFIRRRRCVLFTFSFATLLRRTWSQRSAVNHGDAWSSAWQQTWQRSRSHSLRLPLFLGQQLFLCQVKKHSDWIKEGAWSTAPALHDGVNAAVFDLIFLLLFVLVTEKRAVRLGSFKF